jgi:hypothetical protein
MSQSEARSRVSGCIERLRRPQDLSPTKWIPQSALLDQVHLASKVVGQLISDSYEVEEAVFGVGRKLDEDVDVAVVAKVVPQDGPEERQLTNTTSSTEVG